MVAEAEFMHLIWGFSAAPQGVSLSPSESSPNSGHLEKRVTAMWSREPLENHKNANQQPNKKGKWKMGMSCDTFTRLISSFTADNVRVNSQRIK